MLKTPLPIIILLAIAITEIPNCRVNNSSDKPFQMLRHTFSLTMEVVFCRILTVHVMCKPGLSQLPYKNFSHPFQLMPAATLDETQAVEKCFSNCWSGPDVR